MDTTARTPVSVVLTARDEAERVGPAVRALVAHLDTLGRPWEIVFVDAGSRDGTGAVVEHLGRLEVHRLGTRCRRLGAAARLGVLAAINPIVVIVDRELTRSFSEIGSLIDAVEPGGFDIAVAVSADARGQHRPDWLGPLASGWPRTLAGVVVLHRSAAHRLLGREDWSAHASDFVRRGIRAGMRVASVPLHEASAVARTA